MDTSKLIPDNIFSKFDISLLKPTVTPDEIKSLCEMAKKLGFNICINSCYASLVRELVGPSFPLEIAACVSFPFGTASSKAKAFEASQAIKDGATEIDMVMAIGLLKQGNGYYEAVKRDIQGVVDAVLEEGGKGTKVIIETCYLTDAEKEMACKLVAEAGASFVKTSTGYGTGGATLEDVRLMRRVSPANVKVKAAGGIRTLEQCIAFINAGADRLGISLGSASPIIEEIQNTK